jgi:hypothetical protein
MPVPLDASSYAATHHGLMPTKVLRGQGLSHGQITYLARKGDIVRVRRGIYRQPDAPPSWEQDLLAACLAADGVASHRSARRLWLPEPPGGHADDEPIEITVPRRRSSRLPGATVHRSGDLNRAACTTRRRIPVTTPMRMLLDLGAVAGQDDVTAALDELVVSGIVALEAVSGELEAHARSGRSGIGPLRKALAAWPIEGGTTDSLPELAFLRLCQAAGLPLPEPQHWVVADGVRRRVDFAYPGPRVAIEIDGYRFHTDREVFQDDRWRQNGLVGGGWRILRFTWHDVIRRPDYVATTVRRLLEPS